MYRTRMEVAVATAKLVARPFALGHGQYIT